MRQETKLLLVKIVHTLIWAFMVCVIGFVMWSGLTNDISIYSWVAVAIVIGEGIILIIFKGHCPLTNVARRYSLSEKANFDIFLPSWLAKYNKVIFTTLFAVGFAFMIFHSFRLLLRSF